VCLWIYSNSLAVWRKTLFRDASVAPDQEEGREGDGQRSRLDRFGHQHIKKTDTDGIMFCSPPTLREDGTRRRVNDQSDARTAGYRGFHDWFDGRPGNKSIGQTEADKLCVGWEPGYRYVTADSISSFIDVVHGTVSKQ